jgi:uncharacterized protein
MTDNPSPCPICGRPAVEHHRPFCSRRCADVDLSRWLTGRYVIPVTGPAEDEDDPAPPLPETDADDGDDGAP